MSSVHHRLPVLALVAMLGAIDSARAQTLSLFEQIESVPQAPPRQVARAEQQGDSQPAFTLRSTSRFGDSYRAVLVDRNGTAVPLQWQAGATVPLPGFAGFQLTAVSAREVSLQQPAQAPCLEAPLRGVSCGVGNVAVLQLVTATPLESNGSPAPGANTAADRSLREGMEPVDRLRLPDGVSQFVVDPATGAVTVLSRGEAPRRDREERLRARAERVQQVIEANRMGPMLEAAPGYRVVRTPFGDRQMPVRE